MQALLPVLKKPVMNHRFSYASKGFMIPTLDRDPCKALKLSFGKAFSGYSFAVFSEVLLIYGSIVVGTCKVSCGALQIKYSSHCSAP